MAITPWWETDNGINEKLFGDAWGMYNHGVYSPGQGDPLARKMGRNDAFTVATPTVGSGQQQNQSYIYYPFGGQSPFVRPEFQRQQQQMQMPQAPQPQPMFNQSIPRALPNQPQQQLQQQRPWKMTGFSSAGGNNWTGVGNPFSRMAAGPKIDATSRATRGVSGQLKTSEAGYAPKSNIGVAGRIKAPVPLGVGEQTGKTYYDNAGGKRAAIKSRERIKNPKFKEIEKGTQFKTARTKLVELGVPEDQIPDIIHQWVLKQIGG